MPASSPELPALKLQGGLTTDTLLAMQRSAGNRAVVRMLAREPAPAAEVVYPGAPTTNGKQAPGTAVSTELSDAPDAATPAERVFKWLQSHAQQITAQETQFSVDRRAIAGAIAWEALENPRSWAHHAGGRFVGAGKPHIKQSYAPGMLHTGENVPEQVEQAGLLPRTSLLAREIALYKNSIPYIGAGMRLASDIARKYGHEIASDPGMLTWFWQSKDANSFVAYLSTKQGSTFNPTAEKMPKWVVENLAWLESAVGKSELTPLAPGQEPPKVGTMELGSWKGSYSIEARLPETRQFLVNGGKVDVKIGVYSEHRMATGYAAYVVLHRRVAGSGVPIGEARRVDIGRESNISWSDLKDGMYFLEIFSLNGIRVEGDLEVDVAPRRTGAAAGSSVSNAVQRHVLARQVETAAPHLGIEEQDAGTVATPPDPGTLRANAARSLVQQLKANGAKYGHEYDPDASGGLRRREGWWWNESEFDCSKFVLWVMSGRQSGQAKPGPDESKSKAIRDVRVEPFGVVSDASATASMVAIISRLANEGKATPIDKSRTPRVGDLVFWTAHAAIVVELRPAPDGETWLVWAHMGGSGARLIGVTEKGQYWLKLSEIEKPRTPRLAAGEFLGFWTP